MMSATMTPLPIAELKTFVERISKEFGIKIEYGCNTLKTRDDWVLDMLPSKLAKRLSILVNDKKMDLLEAFH